MMKRENNHGYAEIFLETDLERSKKSAMENMSEIQKQVFSKMSEEQREKIEAGYGAAIINLKTGEEICEFNMENYQPPDWAIESLARSLLPILEEFYSNEENRRKFEEWEKEKDMNK